MPIHIPPVCDFQNFYCHDMIINAADQSIIANAVSPEFTKISFQRRAKTPRILFFL